MSIKNPFLIKEQYQNILWSHMNNGLYYFELLLPMKAMSFQWRKKDTRYIVFPSRCLLDWGNNEMILIKKDTLCNLSLPVKTLETSWMLMPLHVRNQLKENNNLILKFTKQNYQNMKINYVKCVNPNNQDIKFATEQYKEQNEKMLLFNNATKIGPEEY